MPRHRSPHRQLRIRRAELCSNSEGFRVTCVEDPLADSVIVWCKLSDHPTFGGADMNEIAPHRDFSSQSQGRSLRKSAGREFLLLCATDQPVFLDTECDRPLLPQGPCKQEWDEWNAQNEEWNAQKQAKSNGHWKEEAGDGNSHWLLKRLLGHQVVPGALDHVCIGSTCPPILDVDVFCEVDRAIATCVSRVKNLDLSAVQNFK